MTAEVRVFGKRLDGTPRTLAPIVQNKTVHIVAQGTKTLCGKTPNKKLSISPGRARQIEQRVDDEFKGWDLCTDCLKAESPRPDPNQWGPKRPKQR